MTLWCTINSLTLTMWLLYRYYCALFNCLCSSDVSHATNDYGNNNYRNDNNRLQIVIHCHLRSPVLPVVLGFNHNSLPLARPVKHPHTKCQQNWRIRDSVAAFQSFQVWAPPAVFEFSECATVDIEHSTHCADPYHTSALNFSKFCSMYGWVIDDFTNYSGLLWGRAMSQ